MAFTEKYLNVFSERSQRAATMMGMWLYKEGFGFVILSIPTAYDEGGTGTVGRYHISMSICLYVCLCV